MHPLPWDYTWIYFLAAACSMKRVMINLSVGVVFLFGQVNPTPHVSATWVWSKLSVRGAPGYLGKRAELYQTIRV